jgi:hypothetical protein
MYRIYVVQLMYPQIRGRVALPRRTTGGSEASTVLYMYDRSGSTAQNRFAPNKHALCKAVLYSKGSSLGQIL